MCNESRVVVGLFHDITFTVYYLITASSRVFTVRFIFVSVAAKRHRFLSAREITLVIHWGPVAEFIERRFLELGTKFCANLLYPYCPSSILIHTFLHVMIILNGDMVSIT